MLHVKHWPFYVAGAVLLAGAAWGYAEYAEVAAEAERHRQKWESAVERGEALHEALAALDSAWADSVGTLNVRRDSLQVALARAERDREEAEAEVDTAGADLNETLALLQREVPPHLVPVADTARAQFSTLVAAHREERRACNVQVQQLDGLLNNCRARRDHWKARADTALALAEARLERAIAAEDERELWKNKAQWDLLGDGPRALLFVGIGYGIAQFAN